MAYNSSMSHITDMTRKSEKGKEISSSVFDSWVSSETTSDNNNDDYEKSANETNTTSGKEQVAIQRKTMKM